jgi:hypothetical protein
MYVWMYIYIYIYIYILFICIDSTSTCTLDAFCSLLTKKLSYGPHERDMALMHHEFLVDVSNRRELITSTYVG